MSSREDILQSIRRATHVKYEKPDLKPLEDMALTYPSKVEQFYFVMKQLLVQHLIPMIWKILQN